MNVMDFLLAKVSFIMSLIAIIWVFMSVVLILIILVQKGKGGGLSGAFGGMGAGGGLLGTKTGDFLTWVTISLVASFFLGAIVLVKWVKPTEDADLKADAPPVTAGAPEGVSPDALPDQTAPDTTDTGQPIEPTPDADQPGTGTPETDEPQPETENPAPNNN